MGIKISRFLHWLRVSAAKLFSNYFQDSGLDNNLKMFYITAEPTQFNNTGKEQYAHHWNIS